MKNKYICSGNEKMGMSDFADILIRENRLLDIVPILKKCNEIAVKDRDGSCITDGGAFDLMVHIMKNCKENQTSCVDYLVDEFFPNMRKDWLFYSAFIKHRLYMHRRFADDGFYTTLRKIDRDVKSGRLPQDFSTYWKKIK